MRNDAAKTEEQATLKAWLPSEKTRRICKAQNALRETLQGLSLT
jgi:hypothetical protein